MDASKVGRLLTLLAAIVAAVGAPVTHATADPPRVIRIGCAVSVIEAVEDCLRQAMAETSIEFSASASAVLAGQALAGAPFDLVVLADEAWGDVLADAGLVPPDGRRRLAANRLVVVRPVDGHVDGPAFGPPAGRLGVADQTRSPLGRATREALAGLGWADAIHDRRIVVEDARATLQLAETGDVDAAVVYRTDALGNHRVRMVRDIDPRHHAPVVVEAVLLDDSSAARAVFERLSGSSCLGRFEDRGFDIADRTAASARSASRPSPEVAPTDLDLWRPVRTSIRVATVAVLAMLPPGVGLAWWLARSRSRWTLVIESLVALPLVLPPVVVGYLLLRLLGRRGAVGGLWHEHLGVDLAFTWWAAAIASAVMGLPLLVRSARLGIESVDRDLERAAANAGAGRWRTFRRVTLPLAAPGVIAGATLAFARCLGEFGATIVVAGNLPGETRTLALAIWTESRTPGRESQVMLLVAVAIGLSVVATLVSEWLLRRWRSR